MTREKRIGYTTGVFDLFHVGHLNLLCRAKERCDYLIVGVTSDELVPYKGKNAVVPLNERLEIVKAIRYVNEVRVQSTFDKLVAWHELHFDVLFVGDDWKGSTRWRGYESQLTPLGVTVDYLPYTVHTSSTRLTAALDKLLHE